MQVHVSPEINGLLSAAVEISVRRKHFFVGVEHLFEAMLDAHTLLPKGFADRYLTALHKVSRELAREGWQGEAGSMGGEVFYTPRCAHLLNEAAKLAERYGRGTAGAGHLILAVLADAHSAPSRTLDRFGVRRDELIAALRSELMAPSAPAGAAAASQEQAPAVPAKEPKPRRPLDELTRDLTQAAKEGKLARAIARDDEMFQVLQILARKNKSNVMLVGEAGVGKTQVVEGLAVAGVHGGLGGLLAGQRILELSMGALMSGTQYRGAFEEKVQGLLAELERAKNIILFIDEVHLIMGAGATNGDAIDAANLLKPALARGEIRCIGATTLQEYRKFVEKDPSIERRFQMVRVHPLSESATLMVLEKLRPSLERHHGVRISGKVLDAAVRLTQRYMANRYLPDKAIDVLDQACARYRLKTLAIRKKTGATPDGDGAKRPNKVTPHDIRKVISQVTAIPIEEMTAQERLFLSNLEERMKERIIGQDRAVGKTVAAVKKSRAGLADPNRPLAVLLFLGPSGVGKTQLAKVLADMLFGSPKHLITFDMSDYTEGHSVSRLLGAPPGYAGSDEEGLLVGAVRNAPFSVLLLDEIEKAHDRVFDVFLPVFDEGRLKDSRGREVSFRNCIIIMTSNVGADVLCQMQTGHSRRHLVDELRGHFRPEFINRIDDIVPFYPLLFEDVRAILALTMDGLRRRLDQKRISVHVYQGAYEYLAEQGYSPEFGARELRRAVDRLVTSPISEKILSEEFGSGDTIEVLMEGGALSFRKPRGAQAP